MDIFKHKLSDKMLNDFMDAPFLFSNLRLDLLHDDRSHSINSGLGEL